LEPLTLYQSELGISAKALSATMTANKENMDAESAQLGSCLNMAAQGSYMEVINVLMSLNHLNADSYPHGRPIWQGSSKLSDRRSLPSSSCKVII